MATSSDIEQAFRQSGIGRSPTSQDISFYSAYPDAGKIEGDLRAGGGGRSGFVASGATTGASAPATDITGIARQMLALQQEANQPAVSSLQSQIPEIQAGFAQQKTALESQKQPLQARYDAILQQLKGREQQETTQTQTALGREFGRRGIPTSSGMFEQDVLQKTQPISQFYSGLSTEAGLGREEGLRGIEQQIAGLPTQQTEQTRAVQNAIAQLMSGGNATAIQNALQQYQFGQQQQTAQQTAAAQLAQSQAEQAFKEREYQTVTLPQLLYGLNKPYYEPKSTGNTGDPLGLF